MIKWKKKNREKVLSYMRNANIRRYGISLKEYESLKYGQKNRCAICGILESKLKRKLDIDHDHKKGNVRGLLCNSCNKGLGYFRDSVSYIRNALAYLSKGK